MKCISVFKAQAIGDQRIDYVTLNIHVEFPELTRQIDDWLDRTTRLFDEDAQKVVEALHSLPGGTLDRVLVKLLAEKVSQHIIPWENRA